MPTVPSSAMALKNAITLPSIGSLLISAGSGFNECGLCGNSFEIDEFSKLTQNQLPCLGAQCEPCAGMWRILSSPTCPACYADFTCPKLTRDRAQISSPQLNLDANDTIQHQSPSDSPIEFPLSFQDRYAAFYGADADSDDGTISDPGSPMREEDNENAAVSELSDEELQKALILANNRAGTNFNIEEIEAEILLEDLRTGTKTQLADSLTQFCISKASESDENDARDESSQQTDEDGPSDAASQQDGETAQENSLHCIHCRRDFKSAGHLRQHMVVHTIDRRTCSICGQILANPNGRRLHEQKHRETDRQRDERLRKVKVSRDRRRAGKQGEKRKRHERIPQVSG